MSKTILFKPKENHNYSYLDKLINLITKGNNAKEKVETCYDISYFYKVYDELLSLIYEIKGLENNKDYIKELNFADGIKKTFDALKVELTNEIKYRKEYKHDDFLIKTTQNYVAVTKTTDNIENTLFLLYDLYIQYPNDSFRLERKYSSGRILSYHDIRDFPKNFKEYEQFVFIAKRYFKILIKDTENQVI